MGFFSQHIKCLWTAPLIIAAVTILLKARTIRKLEANWLGQQIPEKWQITKAGTKKLNGTIGSTAILN